MKPCAIHLLMAAASTVCLPMMAAWVPAQTTRRQYNSVKRWSSRDSASTSSETTIETSLPASLTTIQVCHGKDCKRIGGGPKLLKAVEQIVQEQDASMASQFHVESCPCQGECGYGPNLVVDDKIVNSVRGRAAIFQALGLPDDAEGNSEV